MARPSGSIEAWHHKKFSDMYQRDNFSRKRHIRRNYYSLRKISCILHLIIFRPIFNLSIIFDQFACLLVGYDLPGTHICEYLEDNGHEHSTNKVCYIQPLKLKLRKLTMTPQKLIFLEFIAAFNKNQLTKHLQSVESTCCKCFIKLVSKHAKVFLSRIFKLI